MYSDYRIFGSSIIAALSLTEPMADILYKNAQQKGRAATRSALPPKSLDAAWDANKRHLLSITSQEHPVRYAVLKEVTVRLDVILVMFCRGEFDPIAQPHMGVIESTMTPQSAQAEWHHPFWVILTDDHIRFIAMQACRFILPLDYMFHEARVLDQSKTKSPNLHPTNYGQLLARFYSAQLLLRLLTLCLTGVQEGIAYDQWIWLSYWRVRKRENGQQVVYTRKGLGLGQAIDRMGTLWFDPRHFEWPVGHLSIAELMRIYIPRSPLQAHWSGQASIQSSAVGLASPAYFFTLWIDQANDVARAGSNAAATT
jgi:hypothetical protein